jgi:hypothetical protein
MPVDEVFAERDLHRLLLENSQEDGEGRNLVEECNTPCNFRQDVIKRVIFGAESVSRI